MSSYVDNVRKNVAGQGRVEELASPPPSRQQVRNFCPHGGLDGCNVHLKYVHPLVGLNIMIPKNNQEAERLREETPSPPPPLPPPPMELLETDPLSYTAGLQKRDSSISLKYEYLFSLLHRRQPPAPPSSLDAAQPARHLPRGALQRQPGRSC